MSLIEILLVLTIIGTVLGLILSNVTGQADRANVKQAQIQLRSILSAIDQYEQDCRQYPADLNALVQNPGDCTNWVAPYLKKTPKDPWGGDVQYELDDQGPHVWSLGKDKRPGGEGVNADISSRDEDKK
jgi:general secretion pathway protein G